MDICADTVTTSTLAKLTNKPLASIKRWLKQGKLLDVRLVNGRYEIPAVNIVLIRDGILPFVDF